MKERIVVATPKEKRSVVAYNHSKKLYNIVDSLGVVVELSDKVKLEAQTKLLHYDCSHIHNYMCNLLSTHPKYFNNISNKKRLVNAAFILRDNHLRLGETVGNYYCLSQAGTGVLYSIILTRLGSFVCDCPDCVFNNKTQDTSGELELVLNQGSNICKHILAVILNKTLVT